MSPLGPPCPLPSYPSRSSRRPELSSLRSTASNSLFISHVVVSLCQRCSFCLSHPLLPLLGPQVRSLRLC